MKTIYITSLFTLFTLVVSANVEDKTYPTINLFNTDYYTITAEKTKYNDFKYTLKNTKNDSKEDKSFSISPNTLESFSKSFLTYFKEIEEDTNTKSDTVIAIEAKRVFYTYIVADKTLEEQIKGPIAGTLYFNKTAKTELLMLNGNKLEIRIKQMFKEIKKGAIKIDDDENKANSDLYYFPSPKLIYLKRYKSPSNGINDWHTKNELKEALKKHILDSAHIERFGEYNTAVDSCVKANGILEDQKADIKTKLGDLGKLNVKSDGITANQSEIKDEINNKKTELKKSIKNYRIKAVEVGFDAGLIAKHAVFLNNISNGNSSNSLSVVSEKLTENLNTLKKDKTDKDNLLKIIIEIKSQLKNLLKMDGINKVGDNYTFKKSINDSKIKSLKSIMEYKVNVPYKRIGYDLSTILSVFESIKIKTSKYKIDVIEYGDILISLNKFKIDVYSKLSEENGAAELLEKKIAASKQLKNEYFPRFINYEIDFQKLNTNSKEEEINKNKIDGEIKVLNGEINNLKRVLKNELQPKYDAAKKEKQLKYNRLIYKTLTIENIEIEFNEGFIENLVVTGKYENFLDSASKKDNPLLKFENIFPIGYSRKMDYDAFKDIHIYDRTYGINSHKIRLEDIFSNYVQKHKVDRQDYSPANQIITINPKTDKNNFVVIKKAPMYRLFEAKIFSDFVGLDETEPNGLIQTEIETRINLNTEKGGRFIYKKKRWLYTFGYLGYIKPFIILSKLEGDNKNLSLNYKDKFVNNQYAPIKHVSTLDLKRYENFSTGFNLNLISFDFTSIKSSFILDLGLSYGRTAIVDSSRVANANNISSKDLFFNEYGVNTFQVAPKFQWLVKADERYRIQISYHYNWFYLRDNRFEQVASNESFTVSESEGNSKHRYSKFELFATLNTNPKSKGKLFFRYRFHWQQGFWNTGFHQAQVGYSFYIFGRDE